MVYIAHELLVQGACAGRAEDSSLRSDLNTEKQRLEILLLGLRNHFVYLEGSGRIKEDRYDLW